MLEAVAPPTDLDDALAALRQADALTARAIAIIGRVMPSGEIEHATGLPADLAIALGARRPVWDARMLCEAARVLRAMPRTARAFSDGELSWPTVRALTTELRNVDVAAREGIDLIVARALGGDPELLLDHIRDEVARSRADLMVSREDRSVERGFLSLQPRLDGHGGSLYAEADSESFATICQAIDTAAPLPEADENARSRARQRLDGLVAVCESALVGGSHRRARPRFLVSVDARDLMPGETPAARALWRTSGQPGRLGPVATDTLLCDAEIQVVVFNGARPIAVGDIRHDPSPKVRAALVARDRGCRFPGCSRPAAWTDAHHIRGRGPQTSSIDDLVLLCRRCHRRVHRHRWRIEPRDDGTIMFRHRGKTYPSSPRAPARE